ncbi:MAG: DedA family protein [Bdellovibrionales bacterium]|nr:DedA family protein [Bdellovibrionales bacterium]
MESSFSYKLLAFLTSFSSWQAYAVILGVLFACGLGIPIPEDITLIGAGILAGIGTISLPGAIIAGMIGVMVGDTFMFFMGKKYGHKVIRLPLFRKIFTQERIRMAEEKIINNSKFICFIARFLPGLRSPVFLSAGMMGVKFWVFFLLDGIAALISVPFWVILAYYLSKNMEQALTVAKEFQVYILIGVVVLITGYVLFKKKKSSRSTSAQINN